MVGGRFPLPSEICAQSDPPPFEKRRLRPISAQYHKHLMVGRNVYRTTVDGVEICIRQLGRVEEIICLPYDVFLSAA